MVGIFGKFKKQSLVRKENIRNSGAQTHKEIMDKRMEGKRNTIHRLLEDKTHEKQA